jgi:hypothetical protein
LPCKASAHFQQVYMTSGHVESLIKCYVVAVQGPRYVMLPSLIFYVEDLISIIVYPL